MVAVPKSFVEQAFQVFPFLLVGEVWRPAKKVLFAEFGALPHSADIVLIGAKSLVSVCFQKIAPQKLVEQETPISGCASG